MYSTYMELEYIWLHLAHYNVRDDVVIIESSAILSTILYKWTAAVKAQT